MASHSGCRLKKYSLKFKLETIHFVLEGHSKEETARRFNVDKKDINKTDEMYKRRVSKCLK